MSLPLKLHHAPSGWLPYEKQAHQEGWTLVAGVDEAGRGCLAGPVVASAAILPSDFSLEGLDDSKVLTEQTRERLYPIILEAAVSIGVGFASAGEIDRFNILRATHLAMQRAVDALKPSAELLLVDGNQPLPGRLPQRTIVKGDSRVLSIAAASVVAKVSRDRWMVIQASKFPQYGFSKHKGYGTRRHRAAIVAHGPCPLHRRTFRGVIEHLEPAERAAVLEEKARLRGTPPALWPSTTESR